MSGESERIIAVTKRAHMLASLAENQRLTRAELMAMAEEEIAAERERARQREDQRP